MTGRPLKNPFDAEVHRREYMNMLESRIQLNNENLQANKIYKATGALPPKSSMADTRTTSEILADVEKLKISLIEDLKPILSANLASEFIQRLQRSPLNNNGSLLTFFAQRAPEFVITLKKMYKYGIKGDTNDLEQFIAFIEKSFSMTKDLSSSVRGYFDKSVYGSGGGGITRDDIDKYNGELKLFRNKVYDKSRLSYISKDLLSLYNELRDRIEGHLKFINSEIYKEINDLISDIISQNTSTIKDPARDSGLTYVFYCYELLLEYMKSLPSIQLLESLYLQFEKSVKNTDETLTKNNLSSIITLLPDVSKSRDLLGKWKESADTLKFLRESLNKPIVTDGTLLPSEPIEEGPENLTNMDIFKQKKIFQAMISRVYEGTVKLKPESISMKSKPLLLLDKLIKQGLTQTDAFTQAKELFEKENNINQPLLPTYGPENKFTEYSEEQLDILFDRFITGLQRIFPGKTLKRGSLSKTLNYLRTLLQHGTPVPDAFDQATEAFQQEHKLKRAPITVQGSVEPPLPFQLPAQQGQTQINPNPPLTTDAELSRIKNSVKTRNPGITQPEIENIMIKYEKLRNEQGLPSHEAYVEAVKLIDGRGLKKRRGRPKGSGIKRPFSEKLVPEEGIKPKPKYISFGKYFINHNKLNDGIFSIRQKSGAGLPLFPSKKLSPHMTQVIKTIVGNGMPSYTDIDKLSDEEKNFLHQIAHKSNIDDILSIPSPSKDKIEKDINQFEIMKGEIMAGNDSKELIKKFKILILRLSKTGTLPKNQVSEIMTELLEMGY